MLAIVRPLRAYVQHYVLSPPSIIKAMVLHVSSPSLGGGIRTLVDDWEVNDRCFGVGGYTRLSQL